MSATADALRAADNEVAQRVLARLQDRIGPQKFNAWFRHCAQLSIAEGHVKVSVPNPFVANWIETHYGEEIAAAVQAESGRRPSVLVAIDPTLGGELRKGQRDAQADIVTRTGEGRVRGPAQPASPALRHDLKDFVVGESNRLAYSAAAAVAEGTATFNPLFLHGPCGVGKTHLLQGICRHAARAGAGFAWRYVTGEQFTNEFISALRQRRLESFRGAYRKLDLLAIDDVHFLAAKKATQDEFLHTFNSIQTAGRSVVMASDAHPHLVGDLNEQLVSRFVAGMVVKIEPPDHATRLAILQRRASVLKVRASADVLEYVACHMRGSVRELEGALVKLAALAALQEAPMTVALANEALADHLARTDSAVTLGGIEAVVAAFFGVTPADLHSSRRTRTVSAARTVSMFLARRHTRMSFPEIGKFMGKNHSSVVLAVQRMEALLASAGEVQWMTPVGTKSMPAAKVLQMLADQIT